MFKKYLIFDLIVIAMLAALGSASKVIIGPVIRILTGAIGIPGGAIAGGFYMLWLGLAVGIVRVRGAATLMAVVQALMVFVTSMPGSHGTMSFITYTLPGIACDLVFIFSKKYNYNVLHYMIGIALANIVGTFGSNLLFFRLPIIPLLLALSSAAISGAVGGLIAYGIMTRLEKIGLIRNKNKRERKVIELKSDEEEKGVLEVKANEE